MTNFSHLRPRSAFTFFDPNDPACLEILVDPQTTIPELFAIVRQWVPQVQHKIDVIGNEVGTHKHNHTETLPSRFCVFDRMAEGSLLQTIAGILLL